MNITNNNDKLEDLSKEMLIAKLRFIKHDMNKCKQLEEENKALKEEISKLKTKNIRGAGRKAEYQDKIPNVKLLLKQGKKQSEIAELLELSTPTLLRRDWKEQAQWLLYDRSRHLGDI